MIRGDHHDTLWDSWQLAADGCERMVKAKGENGVNDM